MFSIYLDCFVLPSIYKITIILIQALVVNPILPTIFSVRTYANQNIPLIIPPVMPVRIKVFPFIQYMIYTNYVFGKWQKVTEAVSMILIYTPMANRHLSENIDIL